MTENEFRDAFVERVAAWFPTSPLGDWNGASVSNGSLIVRYAGREWLVDVQAYELTGVE